MITEFLLSLASGFVGWLAGMFPEWEPPPELTGASDALSGLVATFAGLGVWVDWGVLSVCVAAALTAWAVVVGIKLIRAVAAHIPMFGGAGD